MNERSKTWQRLLRGLGVVLGAVLAFVLYARVEGWIVLDLPGRDRHLLALQSARGLDERLWFSIAAALVLALPEITWQGWRLLVPDATPLQQRTQNRLMPLVTLIPAIGVALGYFAVLPWHEGSFAGLEAHQLRYLPQASAVLRSGVEVLFLTVIALEVPLFVAGLGGRRSPA